MNKNLFTSFDEILKIELHKILSSGLKELNMKTIGFVIKNKVNRLG